MCVCANKFSKGSAPSVTTSEQCFLMTSRTADAMSNEFKPSGGINGACGRGENSDRTGSQALGWGGNA